MSTQATAQTPSTSTPIEPAILSANCYFWSPAGGASARRSNEKRRQGEVAEYLRSLGFTIEQFDPANSAWVIATRGEIKVEFQYRESCKNIYKRLEVTRNGRRSNITAIRKIAAALAA